jgi:hypothetical protein
MLRIGQQTDNGAMNMQSAAMEKAEILLVD